MSDDDKHWDLNIKKIQFAINSMQNRVTKKSPHELLFSYHPRNVLQNKVILALEREMFPEIDLNELRKEALSKIEENQMKEKERYDSKRKEPKIYQEGDLVLVKREVAASGTPRKLAPVYKGPYVVSKVLPNDRYQLQDIPGAPRTQREFHSVFSSDRMKPWCFPPIEDEEGSDTDTEDEVVEDNDRGQRGRVSRACAD